MAPTFLCIGAQRSGTTWLDVQLRQHPQIWMPPVKELHFLDSPDWYPLIMPRINPHARARRLKIRRRVRSALSHVRQPRNVPWVLRYLLAPRLVRCYPWMFMPGQGQVSGEATPNYAHLPPETIEAVHDAMPDMRLIYLLRDPVARIWSHVGMLVSKNPRLVQHTDDEALHTFVVDHFTTFAKHSTYVTNLARWEVHYPYEQFFCGFFEQIVQEPEALLPAIYRFLGVDDAPDHVPTKVHQPRNSRQFRAMPPQTERWITEQMMPEYISVHERFANAYTANWLRRAESLLVCEVMA